MGCDIHSYVESRNADGGWERVPWMPVDQYDMGPFDWRSYGLFGWLADVRNYSGVPPIVEPRGLPDDASADVAKESEEWGFDGHSHSWLTVDELLAFGYDVVFEDLRVTRGNNGGVTAKPGEGEERTYREFLGPEFFRDLDILRALNEKRPARVVFWFDN